MFSRLVEITREESPNEASAFLFEDNTVVVKAEPNRKSIGSFDDIDPAWVCGLIDKYGKPSALFHSHPCAAVPSGKDLQFMIGTISVWGSVWLIMSDKMKLRAWTVNTNPQYRGATMEQELEVVVHD